MTNLKTTKRALLSSVVALFICFTMLLGTTFAWFTDSAISSGNKIVAGTLDVELYQWTDANTKTNISESQTPVFTDAILWEPNMTQVVYLSIKNEGHLALKYKVALEVTSVSEDSLLEVMEYEITPDAEYGDVTSWDGTNAKTVVAGSNATQAVDVELAPGVEHFFALSIHMDEEAGNEYMNESVAFDIKVLAGQLAYETDSFNNTYDEPATYPNVSVPVTIPTADVTAPITLNASGMSIEIPAAVINNLPAEVTSISVSFSEPVVENNTISFASVELIDQNNKKIDLEGNTEVIAVTLPVQTVFAAGEMVFIYHDGELIDTVIVNADGTISYEVAHFCKVSVCNELKNADAYTDEVSSMKADLVAAAYGDTVTVNLNHDAYVNSMINVPNGVTLVVNGNGNKIIANTAYPFYVNNANIQMNNVTIVGKATYAIFTKGARWDYNGQNQVVEASLNNVTINLDKADNYPVVFNGMGNITMTDCNITGDGLSAEGNYRNGTHIFAGAEINLTANGGNIGNVLMNANYAAGSTLTLNDSAVVESLILASEQNMSAVLVNNGGTVNKVYKQVDNASTLKSTMESAAEGETIVINKNIDLADATVTVANGVELLGENDVTVSNALFNIADDQTATFTNLTFAGATTVEAKGDGALSFTNCEFNVAPKMYNGFSRGAAIIGSNQNYTIDLYLEDCTFNYTTGSVDKWNAAIFMWSNVDECVIKNCSFNGYGFMAIKLMNVASGANIVFEGNTFDMCESTAANYYNNNAVQIMPQHDNALTVKFINNTFTGDYRDGTMVAKIEVMHGGTLSNLTFEQSRNTINGETITDANFAINAN